MEKKIIRMYEEMYKDSLFFFEEAEKEDFNQRDNLLIWRNLRAAILLSFSAIEACINQFIDEYIEKNQHKMEQKDIDKWTEKDKHVSIRDKLKDGIELYGGARLSKNHELWKEFKEFQRLRDGLVHYKGKDTTYYLTQKLFDKTRIGIKTTSSIIKEIYSQHPSRSSYPKTFNKIPDYYKWVKY